MRESEVGGAYSPAPSLPAPSASSPGAILLLGSPSKCSSFGACNCGGGVRGGGGDQERSAVAALLLSLSRASSLKPSVTELLSCPQFEDTHVGPDLIDVMLCPVWLIPQTKAVKYIVPCPLSFSSSETVSFHTA